MERVSYSLCILLAILLPSCAAQDKPPANQRIQLNRPQPTYSLDPIDPPDVENHGTPAGNAILVEDRWQKKKTAASAPFTFARTFKRGEFPACVQAAVAGVLAETQCDVKTRWSDGSLRHAVLTFWVEFRDKPYAQVDFVPADCTQAIGGPGSSAAGGLTKSEMLAFLNGKVDATLKANVIDGDQGTLQQVSARDILSKWDGVESATGIRYWLRGPLVTQVIVDDRSASSPFDFGWQASFKDMPVLVKSFTATTTELEAEPPSAGANLADLMKNWRFPATVFLTNEAVQICSVKGSILNVCPKGRGAFGTTPVASWNVPVMPAQGWTKAIDVEHKSLHPIYILTFYRGWNGVKVDIIVENTYINRAQDQYYSVSIEMEGRTVWEQKALPHQFGSRWRKVFWIGEEPRKLRVDHNLAYLIQSRVLPNYDRSVVVNQQRITQTLSTFATSDRGEPMGRGLWNTYFPQTGGRPDIAILPKWYLLYVYTWNEWMQDLVQSMGDVSGHVPIHFREPAGSNREFEPYGRSPAAGRVISIDARPTFFVYGPAPFTRNETAPDERGVKTGPLGKSIWAPDQAHQPDMVYLPYALTGDWYYLEEMYFWSSNNLASANPGACHFCRYGSLGYIHNQMRGEAWALRNLAYATVMAPDGSPEKTYFHSKLRNNFAIREGKFDVQNGHFYEPGTDCGVNCATTRWQVGREILGEKRYNPLRFMEAGFSSAGDQAVDTSRTSFLGSPWMMNFFHASMGVIEDLGFGEVAPMRRAVAANLISQLQDPTYNRNLVDQYHMPIRDTAGNFFTKWADVRAAFAPSVRDLTTIRSDGPICGDCYTAIVRGTASWLTGITTEDGLSGDEGFKWIFSTMPNRAPLRDDPTWAILPRKLPKGFEAPAAAAAPSWYKPDQTKAALAAVRASRPVEHGALRD